MISILLYLHVEFGLLFTQFLTRAKNTITVLSSLKYKLAQNKFM